MKMEQLYRILISVGLSVRFEKDNLKEISSLNGYSYQLMRRDSKWVYSEIDYKSKPDLKIIESMEFATEEEGVKYYLFNRLQSFYLHKYKSISSIGEKITSFADFEKKMKELGIEEDNYSFSVIKPQSFLGLMEDSLMRINYVNRHNKICFSSSPFAFDRGSSILFTNVYLLHLLKNLERNLMNEQVLVQPFTDEYIETFIK